jgi:hypothetical protein
MSLTRWFRVVNWASLVATLRLRVAVRKAPHRHRKPGRPALWPELLEDRTVLSAGAPQTALLVERGGNNHAPAAQQGQPPEAGPAPVHAQSTSQGQGQGDEGVGGRLAAGPDQQGNPADGRLEGDGGNGNEEAGRGLRGENRRAEVPFAPAGPAGSAGSPEIIAALFAAGPVVASSTQGADALVESDLGALSRAGSGPNPGPSLGTLPVANLTAGTLDQAPSLPRASLLNDALFISGVSNPSDFSQFLKGDGAFLELWDRDQLLFPDSLPKADEMQFPGGLPWQREMPLPERPERTPNLGGPLSLSVSLGEPPVAEVATVLTSAVEETGEAAESAPARLDGLEAVGERLEESPADQTDTDRGKDPLRPYKVALGLLPFLPAFGFTAVTLREQVQAGLRWWQELRVKRRRGR